MTKQLVVRFPPLIGFFLPFIHWVDSVTSKTTKKNNKDKWIDMTTMFQKKHPQKMGKQWRKIKQNTKQNNEKKRTS